MSKFPGMLEALTSAGKMCEMVKGKLASICMGGTTEEIQAMHTTAEALSKEIQFITSILMSGVKVRETVSEMIRDLDAASEAKKCVAVGSSSAVCSAPDASDAPDVHSAGARDAPDVHSAGARDAPEEDSSSSEPETSSSSSSESDEEPPKPRAVKISQAASSRVIVSEDGQVKGQFITMGRTVRGFANVK